MTQLFQPSILVSRHQGVIWTWTVSQHENIKYKPNTCHVMTMSKQQKVQNKEQDIWIIDSVIRFTSPLSLLKLSFNNCEVYNEIFNLHRLWFKRQKFNHIFVNFNASWKLKSWGKPFHIAHFIGQPSADKCQGCESSVQVPKNQSNCWNLVHQVQFLYTPLCRKVPAKLIVVPPVFPKMAELAGCGWLLKLAGAKPLNR